MKENKMNDMDKTINNKSILLSEINENNIIDIEEAMCDDPEVELAIKNYEKGRILEDEGKKLKESSKKILDEKMYKRHIHSIKTPSLLIISYTEYTKTKFDSKLFEELNPQLYKKFTRINKEKRYNIKQINNIILENN